MCYLNNPTENIWMDVKRAVHSMRIKFSFAKIGEGIDVARYAKVIETFSRRLKAVDTALECEKYCCLQELISFDSQCLKKKH